MAYTKSPTTDTYSSERVQIFREMTTRDGGTSGKDEDYVNIIIETVKQQEQGDKRKFLMKRAGTQSVLASAAPSNIRGLYFWGDQNKIFYCVANAIFSFNVNTGVLVAFPAVFSTVTGEVGFTEYLYANGTVDLIATDGSAVNGIVTITTAGVVTHCADVDLPAHIPVPIFLDGYLFVAKSSSAELYNSDLNLPLTWSGAYIQAEMEADLIVRIAKLNNYIVVFGRETIEYFWDAGNVGAGGPLQRNDTPIKINTYLAGFAVYGNIIYYVGTDQGGQPDVFMLKDFKIESIGTPAISRYLNSAADGIAAWNGNVLSLQGHSVYVITAGTSKTYVYDVDVKLWNRWAFKQESTFDILIASTITNTYNVQTFFALNDGTSAIYTLNKDIYQDVGVNFTCSIVTENNDFGTMNRKTMKRLSVIGDRPSTNANLMVSTSDNDYQSYSTPIAVNLNQDNPCAYRLGSFRQRVFKLTFTANELFRIQEIEVDINKGNS
jgi:hypothetical protein